MESYTRALAGVKNHVVLGVQRQLLKKISEQFVTIEIPFTSTAACTKRNLDILPLRLRLIRLELESGETEVLITSLTDMEQSPHDLFADLYHDRWPVEEDYKIMGQKMGAEPDCDYGISGSVPI
ncbi:MAG: hypothetical protein K9K37_13340 [Desulfocapsa sp.]|nr:hypothetical protein [Desulfocapsa sp.]